MASVVPTVSPVKDFYKNECVFITGATGFLGKVLLEKILRCCPDVRKVFVLLRPKDDKSVQDRFDKLFQPRLFETLSKSNPDYQKKVHYLQGDLTHPNLGLSEEDMQKFLKEVTIIFHVAATVKFKEPLRKAAYTNVRSLLDLMDMARNMNNLKSFVYVSTAYSNSNRQDIEEKFYPTPISSSKLMEILDTLDDESISILTPKLLENWQNTYVYTKAIAENAIMEKGAELPITIVRPGIVIPIHRDPTPGWADSLFGPVGMILGIAIGVVRCLCCDPNSVPELIPVDYVINSTVTAATVVRSSEYEKFPIFNLTTSTLNPISWARVQVLLNEIRWVYPANKAIWYPFVIFCTNPLQYKVWSFFMHTIPGYIIDGCLLIAGQKPRLLKAYETLEKFNDSLQYFTLHQWTLSTKNMEKLNNDLQGEDKELFGIDIAGTDWRDAMYEVSAGAREIILKDPISTLPSAKLKLKLFYMLNIATIVFFLYLLFKFVTILLG